MSALILFRRDDKTLTVAPLDVANDMMETALATASLIGKVTTAAEQERAVEAQKQLKAYLDAVEESRKVTKWPVWALCCEIESLAKKLKCEVLEEMTRISRLVGDFQTHEQLKARAAEALRLKELAEIERKKQEELAASKCHEQAEAIQEKYNNIAAAVPVTTPARAKGQKVTPDWDIQVTDIWTLARAHPTCVNIEPRMGEIKTLVKAGIKVAGVTATPIVRATVTASKQRLIEV